MPTYDYRCVKCNHKMTAIRTMKEALAGPLCEECGTFTVKIISPVNSKTIGVKKGEYNSMDKGEKK